MRKNALWVAIRDRLSSEIAEGHYVPGDKLPTEADLSRRFGVNRHTVRRALAEMANNGLVHARRGAGVFVAAKPTEYPIGRRVRYHQNLAALGQSPSRAALHLETRLANPREAEALALPHGAKVHSYEGLSLADGAPLALFRSIFPAERFPGLLVHLAQDGSVTAALRAEGLPDYTRASTRMAALAATATQALHLQLREGAPLLRTVSLNVDPEGVPVEYGRTWFAGDRVSLIVTPD